jgi:hypothetical protein
MKESESDKDDVILVTTGTLKLPEAVTNEAANKEMNRIVIVVVALAVAFIGLIAYLISTSG